jgi:4-hydroxybenzoate polyprenyltransferase
MKLGVALRLGRVSNLPTVTSNVLAAVALAGARPSPAVLVALCAGLSLFYVGGMYLNDAFDREIDRRERPERPIPSGQVDAATVFLAGFGLIAAGLATIAVLAIGGSRGWLPVASALGLGALIVFYDMHHKGKPWSAFVMGACRAAVYVTAALVVAGHADRAVGVGAGALLAYVVGLTYVARQENLRDVDNLWPVVVLAIPIMLAHPHDGTSGLTFAFFLLWVGRALWNVHRRRIKAGVTALIAGIALLDALFALGAGRPELALACGVAFVATVLFQRVVPGT